MSDFGAGDCDVLLVSVEIRRSIPFIDRCFSIYEFVRRWYWVPVILLRWEDFLIDRILMSMVNILLIIGFGMVFVAR